MTKKKFKPDKATQAHVDRWADLMMRIIKHPEIADRIPNNANLFFLNDEVVLINGEPHHYRELVKVRRDKKKTAKSKRQVANSQPATSRSVAKIPTFGTTSNKHPADGPSALLSNQHKPRPRLRPGGFGIREHFQLGIS